MARSRITLDSVTHTLYEDDEFEKWAREAFDTGVEIFSFALGPLVDEESASTFATGILEIDKDLRELTEAIVTQRMTKKTQDAASETGIINEILRSYLVSTLPMLTVWVDAIINREQMEGTE